MSDFEPGTLAQLCLALAVNPVKLTDEDLAWLAGLAADDWEDLLAWARDDDEDAAIGQLPVEPRLVEEARATAASLLAARRLAAAEAEIEATKVLERDRPLLPTDRARRLAALGPEVAAKAEAFARLAGELAALASAESVALHRTPASLLRVLDWLAAQACLERDQPWMSAGQRRRTIEADLGREAPNLSLFRSDRRRGKRKGGHR